MASAPFNVVFGAPHPQDKGLRSFWPDTYEKASRPVVRLKGIGVLSGSSVEQRALGYRNTPWGTSFSFPRPSSILDPTNIDAVTGKPVVTYWYVDCVWLDTWEHVKNIVPTRKKYRYLSQEEIEILEDSITVVREEIDHLYNRKHWEEE